MKKALIAALALISTPLAPTPAMAEAPSYWVLIGPSGNGSIYYARRSDLMAGNSTSRNAKLWTMMDYKNDRTKAYRKMMSLDVVDCVAQTYTTISITAYYTNGRINTVAGDGNVEQIIPGSNMDVTTGLLCSDGDGGPTT